MVYSKLKTLITSVPGRRTIRLLSLVALLSITVLCALWQQTSADSEIPTTDRITVSSPSTSPTSNPSPGTNPPATTTAATVRTATADFVVPDPGSLTVVINKQRALPVNYIPANLVVPQIALRYSANVEQSHLRSDAATALEQLSAAANADGLQLALISGYRSATHQSTLYNNSVRSYGVAATDTSIARPGHSEHQTGLAADLGAASGTCDVQACFGDTPEGQWLAAHAAQYGFIARYPAGKDHITGYEYEPWHVRYVGTSAAQTIAAAHQILEEYLSLPYAPEY